MSAAIAAGDWDAALDAFRRDGAVMMPGVFRAQVETIAAGIERNMQAPGPYAAENTAAGDTGRFFDDYCNWQRIPEFESVIRCSLAAELAAHIMGSRTARFFHDHVLVKEPGTSKPTPYHQDLPYYFIDGRQTVSMWVPVDPVGLDAAPRFIRGSHLWEKMVLPVRWLDDSGFYPDPSVYLPVPDPENEPDRYELLAWEMEPGDVVLFDYRSVHGAPANPGIRRRRAFSMRWLGDDVRYTERPGRTSPPFPGHGMREGQTLRDDWFPRLWPPAPVQTTSAAASAAASG